MADIRQIIRIDEDGTATFERKVIQNGHGRPRERLLETKRVSLGALIPRRNMTDLLPVGCRFAAGAEGFNVFVIEEEPGLRTVRWITEHPLYAVGKDQLLRAGAFRLWKEDVDVFRRRLAQQAEFRLAFPYLVKCYLFRGDALEKVTLWYRNAPLSGEDDELFHANLPNRDHDGKLCNTHDANTMRGMSFAEMIAECEREFWGSTWNQDFADGFIEMGLRIPEVATPWDWELWSKKDPYFFLRVPWQSAERTLKEEVESLLGSAVMQDPRMTFLAFQRRAQSADECGEEGPEGGEESAGSVREIELALTSGERTTLKQRDVLVFKREFFDGCPKGARRVIEWFGEASPNGDRSVKLEGVDEPLPLIIGGVLWRGVEVLTKEQGEREIRAGDFTLTIKSVCRFPFTEDWPGRAGHYFIVSRLQLKDDGTVLARFQSEGFYTVLGTVECLHSGIKILPPEETDERGFLRADSVVLADGTRVSKGEVFLYRDGDVLNEFKVGEFLPLTNGVSSRAARMTSGARHEFEDQRGGLSSRLIRKQSCPEEVRLAQDVLRVGDYVRSKGDSAIVVKILEFSPEFDDGWRFFRYGEAWKPLARFGHIERGDWEFVPQISVGPDFVSMAGRTLRRGDWIFLEDNGKILRVDGFSGPSGGIVIALDKAGETAVVIQNWQWNRKITDAQITSDWLGKRLWRGLRCRLSCAAESIEPGKRWTISHFQTHEGYPELVNASGVALRMDSALARALEVRIGVEWRSFADSEIGKKKQEREKKTWLPGEDIEKGALVRYLGGDPKTNREFEQDSRSKTTTALVSEFNAFGQALCEFSGPVAGWGPPERPGQWIKPKFLQRINGPEEMSQSGIKARRISLFDSAECFLAKPGVLLGFDAYDAVVRSGDKVIIESAIGLPGNSDTPILRSLIEQRHVFVAMNVHRETSMELYYLYAGVEFGGKGYNWLGSAQVFPDKLRTSAEWWRKVALVPAKNCRKV